MKSFWDEMLQILKKYAKRCSDQLIAFVRWLAIGLIVGVIVGLVGTAFSLSLTGVNSLRNMYPRLKFLLPVAGLVIVFLYRLFKDENDTGTNMIISSVSESADIPFRTAPLIFISTLLTQLTGGSAGREGAALQLGGSIASRIGKTMKLDDNKRHTIIMCGMSAGFSALFGTPLTATIFSMEMISVGIMHYSTLVPGVVSAYTAYFISGYFGVSPESFPVTVVPQIAPGILLNMLLFGVCTAAVSILFCVVLDMSKHTYKNLLSNPYLRIFCGGCLIVLLTFAFSDSYLGSGITMIGEIFETGSVRWYSFLIKILFTSLTIGAGYKGGEIVPSLCVGAAFGTLLAPVFGIPAQLGCACGMAGVFCGVTNCPLSSLFISFELFGFTGMPFYLVTVATSYMLSGRYGLYRAQKIVYSKTETKYVNENVR